MKKEKTFRELNVELLKTKISILKKENKLLEQKIQDYDSKNQSFCGPWSSY